MAPAIAYTLPAIQIVVNLVLPGSIGFNNTNAGSTLTVSLPQNQSRILPDGYVAHPSIGTAYKISKDKVNWKVARERCLAEGAHLAVIDTNLKLAFLLNQTTSNEAVHVGIHRMYNNTEWVSATSGSTLSNLPWYHGEPDNTASHDVVYAYSTSRGLGNYLYEYARKFACEIPITRN